jgi:aspartate/methionine/tyrosine aminotransferase
MSSTPFRLKPLRPSRISEISEITAASGIPVDEQISFHIGNPVRDEKLTADFSRLVLGESLAGETAEFLRKSIRDAVYYAPRGGYRSQALPPAVSYFLHWLEKQSPVIHYSAGEKGSARELTLITGGILEALRLLLFVLNHSLENMPVKVLHHKLHIPNAGNYPNLQFEIFSLERLQELQNTPIILLLGEIFDSAQQQQIAEYAAQNPLFCVEFSGAENKNSLAKELVLSHRCLRFFPAESVCPQCRDSSLVFAVGENDMIQHLEAAHFRLKGTPAATDIALFEYRTQTNFSPKIGNTSQYLSFLEKKPQPDDFKILQESFLENWLQHHPQYEAQHCEVLSGSARTALALLGHELGLKRVVISDFSWNYEDCFPETVTVPVLPGLHPDVEKLIEFSLSHKLPLLINSPHNATGAILTEAELRHILKSLLPQKIVVIDDLSYQNLFPDGNKKAQPTLKQTAQKMLREGLLIPKDLDWLITVHSLSKTDCFAGGRLCVTELSHPQLKNAFHDAVSRIQPHTLSLLIAASFYRQSPEIIQNWYHQRNVILEKRMQALAESAAALSEKENPYQIKIVSPEGAMYPRLEIGKMPEGLEPNAIADRLAARGIGLIPYTNFSRTQEGVRIGRRMFRLTLGGDDSPELFGQKGRRLIETLTQLLTAEEAKFRAHRLPPLQTVSDHYSIRRQLLAAWERTILQAEIPATHKEAELLPDFLQNYLPQRLAIMKNQIRDRLKLFDSLSGKNRGQLVQDLKNELFRDELETRIHHFRQRPFDRTVHPTQMYALEAEEWTDRLCTDILHQKNPDKSSAAKIKKCFWDEYFGNNISLSSEDEARELVTDLAFVGRLELWQRQSLKRNEPLLLSFWGDWDGSNRPPGQGQRLVASVLMETIDRQLAILQQCRRLEPDLDIPLELSKVLRDLPRRKQRFISLLEKITKLTFQLGKRYEAIAVKAQYLPKKHLFSRDPLEKLIHHNDRLEKRMQALRRQRYNELAQWFQINKTLRKFLHSRLEIIEKNISDEALFLAAASFVNPMKRLVITPRIHQNILTSQDPFTIDTIVENLLEINVLGSRYGHPGIILGLQVSMADDPDALINLDRKLRARREEALRQDAGLDLPQIAAIPLFEGPQSVKAIPEYLDQLWRYVRVNHSIYQTPAERFSEMICEIFIAGSDLSQEVGQSAGQQLYLEAAAQINHWLASHALLSEVRIKLGSGEPMQRQGGYYDPFSGATALTAPLPPHPQINESLHEALRRARSPLRGLHRSSTFRTVQSNAFEHLRQIPLAAAAEIWHHMAITQQMLLRQKTEAMRSIGTRVQSASFYQPTGEKLHPLLNRFIELSTCHFRHILYGQPDDLAGIHLASYFISRATPALRDRPVFRPEKNDGSSSDYAVVRRMANSIPLSEHGTLLRAIGHNRSQTLILGMNQLSTGLFIAMHQFISEQPGTREGKQLLLDVVLPHLPVQDILHTLRIYQDRQLGFFNVLRPAFPAGNSAIIAMDEEQQLIPSLIPLLQQELWRRHGIYEINAENPHPERHEILRRLRPDLAVLLQDDLFNSNPDCFGEESDFPQKEQYHELTRLLAIPAKIHQRRMAIMQLLGNAVRRQIESFMNISAAVYHLKQHGLALPGSAAPERAIQQQLRQIYDSGFRELLFSSLRLLEENRTGIQNVPLRYASVLKDIETITLVEKQILSPKQQEALRFHILHAARLAGENG